MNTRSFLRIRKWISILSILSILSSVLAVPTASAAAADDYVKAFPDWATEATQTLADGGFRDTKLKPDANGNVTRAAACYMFVKMFGEDSGVDPADIENPFSDVPDTEWYADSAKLCASFGWMVGKTDDEGQYFMGNKPFLREEFGTVLWSMAGKPDVDESVLDDLPDASSFSEWALKGNAFAKEQGLLHGGAKADTQVPVSNAMMNLIAVNFNTAVSEGNVELSYEPVEEVGEEEEEEEETPPGEEEETPPGEEEETPPAPQAGALTVALATSTPASKTMNPGANGVPLASFTFSVGADEAVLSGVAFHRVGGGAPADFSAVTLYQGETRLKAGKTISTDTNLAEFAGLNLKITPTAPVTLTLKGDLITTAAAASPHAFEITGTSAVTTTAGSVVGLPVVGNTMTIGGAIVGAVTIAPVNTLSKPTLGAKAVEVSNVKLTAGANDISFRRLSLTHGGTISRSNLVNFKLTDNIDSTKFLASAEALSGDLLVFNLTTPYTVPKNNNRSFRVWADVTGGKTADTLDFYLDETSDLDSIDTTVGYGARVTNTMTKALVTDTTFQGGKITLADNGPVAQNVASNQTNVHLFDFALTSDRNVTVKDYYLWLEQTAFDNAGPATGTAKAGDNSTTTSVANVPGDLDGGNISTAGVITFQTDTIDDGQATGDLAVGDVIKFVIPTVTAGTAGTYYGKILTVGANSSANNSTATLIYPTSVTAASAPTWVDGGSTLTTAGTNDFEEVFDIYLATRVKNLKLINTDTQGTIASVTNSTYLNVFSDDFDVMSGKTLNLAFLADLDSTLPANNAFKGGVDFAESNFIKDPDANEFIATSDVVGGNTFGKSMTAVAASLTVSRASTPVSETHVKGQTGVNLLGLSMKAGDGGDVRISKVVVRLVADDDSTFDNTGYGDLAANTVVDSAELYRVNADNTETKVGTTAGLSLVGTIGAAAGYYKAEFASLNYNLAKSVSEKWLVKVKLKNTVSSTNYVSADLIPGVDVEAQDKDGNTVTPVNAAASPTLAVGDLAVDTSPSVMKTIATSGSLTGVQEGSPDPALVVGGATGVTLAKYKFNTLNEAFTVSKLDVVIDSNSDFTDDESDDTGTNNVTRVGVSYAKKDGTTETVGMGLSSGKASFTNLNIYVPKDGSAVVSIFADFNTTELGATSGGTVRLGLNERNTAATNSFEAIGEGSTEKKTVTDLTTYTNSSAVNSVVLRKSVPTVAKLSTAATKLNNGQNDIAAITVAADAKEAVTLKRLAFEYSSTATITVGTLDLYRKVGTGSETSVTSQVTIRNRAGVNLKSGGTNLNANAATTDTIYVQWDKAAADQEPISKGTTNTYIVRATVSGAAANTSLSTYIADDTTRYVVSTASSSVNKLRATEVVTSPEAVDASTKNNRSVWYYVYNTALCDNTNVRGCVFMDVNGNGSYDVATDPEIILAAGVTTGLTSAAIIPGTLRVTTDTVAGAFADSLDGLYFDLSGVSAANGTYSATDDVAFGLAAATGGVNVNNAAVVNDLRWAPSSSTIYIDRNVGGGTNDTYQAANDDKIAATITLPTTAPTAETEAYTSNFNFIWSDNSAASHTTSTVDWTNGVDVSNLPTQTLSLSF